MKAFCVSFITQQSFYAQKCTTLSAKLRFIGTQGGKMAD